MFQLQYPAGGDLLRLWITSHTKEEWQYFLVIYVSQSTAFRWFWGDFILYLCHTGTYSNHFQLTFQNPNIASWAGRCACPCLDLALMCCTVPVREHGADTALSHHTLALNFLSTSQPWTENATAFLPSSYYVRTHVVRARSTGISNFCKGQTGFPSHNSLKSHLK